MVLFPGSLLAGRVWKFRLRGDIGWSIPCAGLSTVNDGQSDSTLASSRSDYSDSMEKGLRL